MNKIPFTHVINSMILLSFFDKRYFNYCLPLSIGALYTGSVIAQFYPHGISKKYKKSINFIRWSDLFIHWFPSIYLLLNTKNSVLIKQKVFSLIFPLCYFSLNSNLKFTNPINSLQNTYPDVPLWCFSLYIFGVFNSSFIQKKIKTT